MKTLLRKYGHIWVMSYGFLYLSWFAYLEKTVTTSYHVMYMKLDDYIPFYEVFVVPYLLWFLYVTGAIAYFFLTNKEDYYRLCTFLFTGMTISLLVCTIFPNGTDLRPAIDPQQNIFSYLVSLIYRADTCTNVFPSIHVYNSIAVHVAIMKSESLKKNRVIRTGSFVLMILICMSTVFLKQHSIVDVFGAIIMAAVIYPLAYNLGYSSEREKKPQGALIR